MYIERTGIFLEDIFGKSYNRDRNSGKLIAICCVQKKFLIRTIGCGVHYNPNAAGNGVIVYLN